MPKPTTLRGSALVRASPERWDAKFFLLLLWIVFCVFSFLLHWFYGPGVVISQTQGETKTRLLTMHIRTHRRTRKTSRRTQGIAVRRPPGGFRDFWHGQQHIIPPRTHTQRSGDPPHPPLGDRKREAGRGDKRWYPCLYPPTTSTFLLFIQFNRSPTHPSTSPCSLCACPVWRAPAK